MTLEARGWDRGVGLGQGIWIRADTQQLILLEGPAVRRIYPCSTASAGLGNQRNSLRTPTGWHEIAEKHGDGLPAGAVFEKRLWTGRMWDPSIRTETDLILSRILRLRGREAGRNRDGDVDTWSRFIYVHGTNAEEALGRPASHGCIRLSNTDMIELYDLVSIGCPVLITAAPNEDTPRETP